MILLIAAVFWIYWVAVDGPFLWDDDSVIFGNWQIVGGKWRDALTNMWRGILILSFALTVRFFGASRRAFHVGNILIHTLNSFLMIGMARTVGFTPFEAPWIGLLFACHSLAVASVAQISGRSGSLMGTFWIAALWAHLAGHPLVAVIGALAAIWVREDATVLLLTLAVLSHSFYGLLYLTTLVLAVRRRYRINIRQRFQETRIAVEPGLHSKIRPQPEFGFAVIEASLLNIVAWSFGLGHDFDYELPPIAFPFPLAAAVLLLLTSTGIAHIAVITILVNPWLVSALIPSKDPILEHRFYAVLPGIVLLVGTLARATSFWIFLPAIVGMASRSRYLASPWSSDLTLWTYIYRGGKSLNPMVRLNLGNAYFAQGDKINAVHYWREAVALCPNAVAARSNLATAAWSEGRIAEAEQQYEAVLRDWSIHTVSLINLGKIYKLTGRMDKAEQCFREVIRLAPAHHAAYGELGGILSIMGRTEEAIEMYATASFQRPDLDVYLSNQVVLNIRLGNLPAAAALAQRLPNKYRLENPNGR